MGILRNKSSDSEDEISLHHKVTFFIRRAFLMLIYGSMIAGIGYVIALLIKNRYQMILQDAAFIVGVIFLILGALMMMKGNPNGGSMSGVGMKNANQINYMNLEVTRLERERTGYYQDFKNHSIVEFTPHRICVALGGALLILFSILFL